MSSNESKTCSYCGADIKGGQFCNFTCETRSMVDSLRNENLDLQNKLTLLNAQRTSIWPDMAMTCEQNVLIAKSSWNTLVVNMTPDEIFVYHKMVTELATQSLLVITKRNIKLENDKKVKDKLNSDVKNTRELNETKSTADEKKVKFQQDCDKKGMSRAESDRLWKFESKKEGAIKKFMEIMHCTREVATAAIEATKKT